MDSARFHAQVDATALICLGRVSHENTVKALGYKQSAFTFGHGARHYVEGRTARCPFSTAIIARVTTRTPDG
jgi:hypothetical protein